MLNRTTTTAAATTTTTTNKSHSIRQNCNKVCSTPAIIFGERGSSSSPLSSRSTSDNNTDAILFEAQNSLVISSDKSGGSQLPPKSSLRKLKQSLARETTVSILKPLKLGNKPTRIQLKPVNPKLSKLANNQYLNGQTNLLGQQTYKMINPIYYLVALLLTLCAITSTTPFVLADSLLQSNMQKFKISPDIISVTSSISIIKVEVHNNVVKPGDTVPVKNFKDLNLAKITWDSDDHDVRYTLLLLDVDRKLSSNGSHIYNQFTSINIPGNQISNGQTVVAYEQPTVPCQPSTKHRILMLALQQDQNIDLAEVAYISASSGSQSSRRENFKLDDFIKRNRLDLVAANVFLAAGETNGVCSGSETLHSLKSVSSILIAMVISAAAFNFRRR